MKLIRNPKDLWWEYGWNAIVAEIKSDIDVQYLINHIAESAYVAGCFRSPSPEDIFHAQYLMTIGKDQYLVLAHYPPISDIEGWMLDYAVHQHEINTLDYFRHIGLEDSITIESMPIIPQYISIESVVEHLANNLIQLTREIRNKTQEICNLEGKLESQKNMFENNVKDINSKHDEECKRLMLEIERLKKKEPKQSNVIYYEDIYGTVGSVFEQGNLGQVVLDCPDGYFSFL